MNSSHALAFSYYIFNYDVRIIKHRLKKEIEWVG